MKENKTTEGQKETTNVIICLVCHCSPAETYLSKKSGVEMTTLCQQMLWHLVYCSNNTRNHLGDIARCYYDPKTHLSNYRPDFLDALQLVVYYCSY